MKDAIEKKEKAVKDDKSLRIKVKNLESELDRKLRLAIAAAAARSSIKSQFDEA